MQWEHDDKIPLDLVVQGAVFEYRRAFSRAEILAFADLSGDHGEHHVHGDRLMAHGLLVASIVTKIGGDLNYISQEMLLRFEAPVYEGEEVTGRITLTGVIDKRLRKKIEMECNLFKGDVPVVSGTSYGQILRK
jgi:acyl dehydratase